jgi:hypothetical protein
LAKVFDRQAQAEVEVSAKDAQEGILAGRYAPRLGRHSVVLPSGKVGTIPAETLGKALSRGARLVEDEEAAKIKLERENSSTGMQIVGGIESALSGASLGATRLLEEAVGVDPAGMEVRESPVLELAGSIAPGLVSGGAGFGVTAAKTAAKAGAARTAASWLPAGIVARGARTAEAMAGAASAQGVRKAVPAGVGAFVEGVGFGAGAEIDESVLGDREMAVESIAMSGVLGGALGTGLGGAIGGLGRTTRMGLSKAAGSAADLADEVARGGGPKAMQEVIERGTGNTAPIVDPLPGKAAKLWSFTSGAPEEDLQRLGREALDPEGQKRLLLTPNEKARNTETLAAKIREKVDVANAAVTDAVKTTEGVNFMRGVDFDFSSVKALEASRMVENFVQPAKERLDNVLLELSENVGDPRMRTMAQYVSRANSEIDSLRALTATDRLLGEGAKPTYGLMNDAQRVLRATADELESFLSRNPGFGPQDRRAVQAIRDSRDDLVRVLGDEDTWGEAARQFKTSNSLKAAALSAREKANQTSPILKKILARDVDAPPTSYLTVARRIGRGAGSEDDLMHVLDSELAYIRQFDNLDTTSTEMNQAAYKAVDDLKKLVTKHKDDLESFDLMDRFRQTQGSGSPSIGINSTIGSVTGSVVGAGLGAVAGPLGSAIGSAAGGAIGYALTSPLAAARTYASLKRMMNKSEVSVDGALGKLMAGIRKVGDKARSAERSLRAPTPFRPSRVSAQLSTDRGSRAKRREEAEATRKAVAYAITHPGSLASYFLKNSGLAGEHAPRTVEGLGLHAEKAAEFLHSKAPVAYNAPFASGPGVVNPVDQAKWERYVEGVLHPIVSLEMAAAGRLSVEHVEALAAVYPVTYQQIRSQLLTEVAAAEAEGRTIPLQRRLQLGLLLDVPTDFSLTTKGYSALQLVHTKRQSSDLVPKPPAGAQQSQPTPAESTEI